MNGYEKKQKVKGRLKIGLTEVCALPLGGAGKTLWRPDMRYYTDAADTVCVKNIRLCVKYMLEFTRLTRNVTI